jgi:hypothetical protein
MKTSRFMFLRSFFKKSVYFLFIDFQFLSLQFTPKAALLNYLTGRSPIISAHFFIFNLEIFLFDTRAHLKDLLFLILCKLVNFIDSQFFILGRLHRFFYLSFESYKSYAIIKIAD